MGAPKPRAWWALRQFGPFIHAPVGGPWSFGSRPSYVAAPEQGRSGDVAASTQQLVLMYLEGFGPASAHDIAQFSVYYRPLVREALESLGAAVERLQGPNGNELFDARGGLLPPEDSPAPPRLMAMWDSALLAYADRSRIVPPEYRTLVMRINGDVLPTLLVDGYVAGVWRPAERGIEATAFHRLSRETWHGLEAEARRLVAFLADRDQMVYRRYAHWWTRLPSAEVRVLGR